MNEQKILLLMISFGVFLVLGLVAIPAIEKVQALLSSPDHTTDFSADINGLYNQLKHDEDKVTASISNTENKIPGAHGGLGAGIQFCDPSGQNFVIPSC